MTTETRARRRAETEARQANERADKLLDDRNDALRRLGRLQAALADAEKMIAALEAKNAEAFRIKRTNDTTIIQQFDENVALRLRAEAAEQALDALEAEREKAEGERQQLVAALREPLRRPPYPRVGASFRKGAEWAFDVAAEMIEIATYRQSHPEAQ